MSQSRQSPRFSILPRPHTPTSSPASGKVYAAAETITVRVAFPQTIQSAMGASLNMRIGDNARAASAPNRSTSCGMTLDFSRAVVAADYDADGVTVSGGISATARYWDVGATGIADDADANMPEGQDGER